MGAWQNQTSLQNSTLKHEIKQVLIGKNLQHWQSTLDQSTKARYYSFFKQGIQLKKYALQLNKYDAIVLGKFQTGNRFLSLETGRCEGIDIRDRTCACKRNSWWIPLHYNLSFFNEQRKILLIRCYYTCTRPNTVKFQQLMHSSTTSELSNLCKLINHLNKIVNR